MPLREINAERSFDFWLGGHRDSVSSWALKSPAKHTVPSLQKYENVASTSHKVPL